MRENERVMTHSDFVDLIDKIQKREDKCLDDYTAANFGVVDEKRLAQFHAAKAALLQVSFEGNKFFLL